MNPVVVAAIITGGFSIIAILVQHGSNKHSQEHNKTREILLDVKDSVDEIKTDLHNHINDGESHTK